MKDRLEVRKWADFCQKDPGVAIGFWEERGAANVAEGCLGHVDLCILQTRDAYNGDVEAPRISHVSVRIAAGHVDPSEETLGNPHRHKLVSAQRKRWV